MPRLQAGQGRAKVRGPDHPCTRGRVRPGERGSGPERCWEGPRCPDECLRRPEPPHPAAGRPARPPGARPRPVATARVTAQVHAHLGRSERLRRSCTRGSGLGAGSGVPRGDPAYGGRGRPEELVSRAKMASAPPRCHVGDTPRHAPRPASVRPPHTHPELARVLRRPRRTVPTPLTAGQ